MNRKKIYFCLKKKKTEREVTIIVPIAARPANNNVEILDSSAQIPSASFLL